jgi:hypothetical protein
LRLQVVDRQHLALLADGATINGHGISGGADSSMGLPLRN